ncbi:hypothetical protein COCNU_06G015700 [Cocos nucifera]|uniref:Uncharacterized protein n=1 Tax=Cocos nucifera TaxID=13894 RepID=A0A8K0ICJ3_COCNU|nr:hypothetical protein COCNU_06G015700 [Cocos nucifera]
MAGLLLLRRRRAGQSCHHSLANLPEPLTTRSGSFRPVGEALALLVEGPKPDVAADSGTESRREGGWGHHCRIGSDPDGHRSPTGDWFHPGRRSLTGGFFFFIIGSPKGWKV